jgi:alanine dehydrogenase
MSQLYHLRGPLASTLILTRREVSRLLSLDDCITAVEAAFRAAGQGRAPRPGLLGYPAIDGGFHLKAASLDLGRQYFAVKANANFPNNRARHGLPTIQGVIALSDARNGALLALLDSMEITALRTGAATAVAAKYLARTNAAVVTICGCGNQGRVQLRALTRVRPVTRVYAYDTAPGAALHYAHEMAGELNLMVTPVQDLTSVADETEIWVTCTPSRRSFLGAEHVTPGALVAAVGADTHDKQELDPALLTSGKLVVDAREQCAAIGDLHHAIAAGVMGLEDVHAELGEVVAGLRAGRTSDREIIVFDSTGTALQDVASAAIVYERALRDGAGLAVALGD